MADPRGRERRRPNAIALGLVCAAGYLAVSGAAGVLSLSGSAGYSPVTGSWQGAATYDLGQQDATLSAQGMGDQLQDWQLRVHKDFGEVVDGLEVEGAASVSAGQVGGSVRAHVPELIDGLASTVELEAIQSGPDAELQLMPKARFETDQDEWGGRIQGEVSQSAGELNHNVVYSIQNGDYFGDFQTGKSGWSGQAGFARPQLGKVVASASGNAVGKPPAHFRVELGREFEPVADVVPAGSIHLSERGLGGHVTLRRPVSDDATVGLKLKVDEDGQVELSPSLELTGKAGVGTFLGKWMRGKGGNDVSLGYKFR